mgnify:CR=1 FL=1
MHSGTTVFRLRIQMLLAIICMAVLFTGCDPAFNPIQHNDRYFSVFGYLNASADTQFVRIEKLRDGRATDSPLELDAEVTLSNISTGQTVAMQDSIFEYYQQGRAHNFYTTMDIHPNQKYRLEINGKEGASSVEVEVPDLFPEPTVLANDENRTSVKMHDINRLISVKTIFYTCSGKTGCGCKKPIRYTYSHLRDTLQMNDGSVKAKVNLLKEKKAIATNYPAMDSNPNVIKYYITKYDVGVAGGNAGWPNYLDLNPEEVALPEVATNINNGVGYLGGIVSDTLNMLSTCSEVTVRRDEL